MLSRGSREALDEIFTPVTRWGGHSPWNNNGGIGWANGKETIQGGVNQESESYKSMMVDSAHI